MSVEKTKKNNCDVSKYFFGFDDDVNIKSRTMYLFLMLIFVIGAASGISLDFRGFTRNGGVFNVTTCDQIANIEYWDGFERGYSDGSDDATMFYEYNSIPTSCMNSCGCKSYVDDNGTRFIEFPHYIDNSINVTITTGVIA